MAIKLAQDFKEFLSLLNSHAVEYLLIGGYAVAVYGYVRATHDLDIWVNPTPENDSRVRAAVQEFGFAASVLDAGIFTTVNNVIRMGVAPMRIEILTSISGVSFEPCYAEREIIQVDTVPVTVISLARLRENKVAAGSAKDLADLDHLPE